MTEKLNILAACILACLATANPAAAEGLPKNWPMPPSELERRFAHDDFKILEAKSAGAGVTGAYRFKLQYADGKVMKVKWKPLPGRDADGWNNSPRKEMAAYAIQRWILDENDYLVPTVMPYCIPVADYAIVSKTAKASYPHTGCMLGTIAAWVDDVKVPDRFWYPKRFESDPAYARSMADFNLLTYLFEHRDGRQGNLMISTVPGDPRVFAIDNGIAFDPFPWNFFVPNWFKIRVPWLNRDRVERLRSVDQAKLDALGVVAEVELGKDGIFRQMEKPGPNLDPKKGVRVRKDRIQFGLSRKEIGELRERIKRLLTRMDSGEQPVR